jgi:uncharacterized protein
MHPDLYNQMIKLGMIVSVEVNESDMLINSWKEKEDDPSCFNMIINPTLECNLCCWYCYEKHDSKTKMNSDIVESIHKLIQFKAANENLRSMNISFFGGEPLIYFDDIVYPILKDACRICNKYKIRSSSNFTTNGILITTEILDKIKNLGLYTPATYQITIDGNRDFHNRVRYGSGRTETFDIIVKNIHNSIHYGSNVSVRFNYTADNIYTFIDVLSSFTDLDKKEKELVSFNFQQIWQDIAKHGKIEKDVENVSKIFEQNGFRVQSDTIYTRHNCYADTSNSVVINYNGDIFKCTARDFLTADREGVLLKDGTLEMNEKFQKRMDVVYANKSCKECSILPLCNGYCSQRKLESPLEKGCYRNLSEKEREVIIHARLIQFLHSINESSRYNN